MVLPAVCFIDITLKFYAELDLCDNVLPSCMNSSADISIPKMGNNIIGGNNFCRLCTLASLL